MKQLKFKVLSNVQIADKVYKMTLSGDTTDIKCGQFVNIQIDGAYLRRPISVCDYSDSSLTLVYKVVGEGNFNIPHFLGILKAKKPFINVLLEASTPENVKASCDYIRGCYDLA